MEQRDKKPAAGKTRDKVENKFLLPSGCPAAVFFLFLVLVSTPVANSRAAQITEAINMAQTVTKKSAMEIKSPAFPASGFIPEEFSCRGNDSNPPLVLENVPKEARSLALIIDDPDAPAGTWVHWVMWNIQPDIGRIEADSVPPGAVQGVNSWGKRSYGGPCPPSGTHHYHFKLYALDTKELPLAPGSGKKELETAMKGHILAHSEIMGLFSK